MRESHTFVFDDDEMIFDTLKMSVREFAELRFSIKMFGGNFQADDQIRIFVAQKPN